MRPKSSSTAGHRGSALILFTLMLPFLIVPLAGLGIDATMCYIVQAKLGSAVDGAALGAGRLLGTKADTAKIAEALLRANFPTDGTAGFWGATFNKDPTIVFTNGITKTISIDAQVKVPLLFARVFGQSYAVVSAAGTAQRTDSRVMLVIDRSGSMSKDDGTGKTVLADAKSYAAGFVAKFTESADELGLVIFDGSAVVAYPNLNPNWDPTTTNTSTGGPDAVFNDPNNTHNMVNQINAIKGFLNKGQTGTADALWLAYIELQKAHLKDLKKDTTDLRLNSIVLLTDGLPQAVSVWPNNPADNAILAASPCTNNPKTNAAPKPMLGWVAVSTPFAGTTPTGLYQLASRDPLAAHDSVWWAALPTLTLPGDEPPTNPKLNPDTAVKCSQPTPGDLDASGKTDFGRIPSIDMWGNDMTAGRAYKTNSQFVDKDDKVLTNPLAITLNIDPTQVTDGDHWALSFWNATDDAARRIRIDDNLKNRGADIQNMNIQIFVIGYAGNGGVDRKLLKRVSNDPGSSSFVAPPDQATGLYVSAGNPQALSDAFDTIAEAILRLSK